MGSSGGIGHAFTPPSAIRRASAPNHPQNHRSASRSITERRLIAVICANRATPPTTLPCHEGKSLGFSAFVHPPGNSRYESRPLVHGGPGGEHHPAISSGPEWRQSWETWLIARPARPRESNVRTQVAVTIDDDQMLQMMQIRRASLGHRGIVKSPIYLGTMKT